MIDDAIAERHGVCPVCEGYGGTDEPCRGCNDGDVPGLRLTDDFEPLGSWEAYLALRPPTPTPEKEKVDPELRLIEVVGQIEQLEKEAARLRIQIAGRCDSRTDHPYARCELPNGHGGMHVRHWKGRVRSWTP